MARGKSILEGLRAKWATQIGAADLMRLEALLAVLVGDAAIRIDAPGWAAEG